MKNFIFGIHNHQPVGNFDGVFHQTYKDCYLPFIEVLEKYPKVRLSLHFTGPLLEWIEKEHPEYFDKLKKLSDRKQIEFMGGGFYEPLLPVIPKRDAIGQIKMMQDYIHDKFGVTPKGMWLAERVWEPGLPSIIAKAGLKYVTIDDTHFYYAGFKEQDMFGYYVTEDQGNTVNVFPIDKELRYRVPFSLPEQTIEYLKTVPDDEGVTLADDGEKFGVWPGTYKWVYTDKYLERLFAMLTENSSWINMITFSEYMEEYSPKGKVFLPTASYDEMMEWSLPVESQAIFTSMVEEFKKNNQYARMRPYLRGGFWRNFLVKYPESNQMYSKMMYVSDKIEKNSTAMSKSKINHAIRALYRGQCNCSYWHGLFGGLYLNYLRHAIYSNLIEAENIIDSETYMEQKDYNFDGHKEMLFSNSDMNLYLSPNSGGQILELDYRTGQFNLSNVLTRRPEAYHIKVHDNASGHESNQPKSIHDVVKMKEEGLGKYLSYDWYKRNSLIDHILSPYTNLENFSQCKYGEDGDFVNQPYNIIQSTKKSVILCREGSVFINGTAHPLIIKKSIEMDKSIEVTYELQNKSKESINVWFGIEFNLTLLAGNAKDRYYRLPDKNNATQLMNVKKEIEDSKGLEIVDEYLGFKAELDWDKSDYLWRFPVETVSHSESGLERTYQGSCIMPSWKLKLDPGEKNNLKLNLHIKQLKK